MIQTEQLSPDTIMFYVKGPFYKRVAKELSLTVFRSHRLGFKTFLFNLSQVSFIDDQGSPSTHPYRARFEGKRLHVESHPASLLNRESTHSPYFASTISPGHVELTTT